MTTPKDGVDVPRAADPLEGAPEVCEGCGAIEARNESHHHACPRGVQGTLAGQRQEGGDA